MASVFSRAETGEAGGSGGELGVESFKEPFSIFARIGPGNYGDAHASERLLGQNAKSKKKVARKRCAAPRGLRDRVADSSVHSLANPPMNLRPLSVVRLRRAFPGASRTIRAKPLRSRTTAFPFAMLELPRA